MRYLPWDFCNQDVIRNMNCEKVYWVSCLVPFHLGAMSDLTPNFKNIFTGNLWEKVRLSVLILRVKMSKITLVFSLLYHFWLEWSVWEFSVLHIEYNGIIAPVILEMLDDWSRIASYLAIITLYKVIIVGAINFKMAASSLVCVTEEVMNMIKEIQIRRV